MTSLKSSALRTHRRDFFRLGSLAIGAISPLGLSLSEVLANEAASGGAKRINVIFMFLQGGASHIDMYDMKPDAPREIRGKYSPASTNIPGLQLSDRLPKLCGSADKFSIIRSMHSYSSKHGEGDVDIMCGSRLIRTCRLRGSARCSACSRSSNRWCRPSYISAT